MPLIVRPVEEGLAAARQSGLRRPLTRPGQRSHRLAFIVLSAVALLCAAVVPAIAPAPASAGTIQTLRSRASALASSIDAAYARLGVLDEAYNQANTNVSEMKRAIATQDIAITENRRQLAADGAHLRAIALDAYVNGASGGFSAFFTGSQQAQPMQQAYLSAASGNINEAVANVEGDRHLLAVHRQQLRVADAAEIAARLRITGDIRQAEAVTASLEGTLSQVKGQLAQAVAAQERARAAAAAAAIAAQPPAPLPPPSTPPASTPPAASTPPTSTAPASTVTGQASTSGTAGGGAGAIAVRAAESQIGVPYVWGGATPGVGFDCSGLAMWAWAQAGVQLAHGATEQYYEIAHVSMSDLQPGDLIFYGNASYLYHVVIYVGSGPYGSDTVVQAEETGTNVMYSPIPPGAYGAGQP